MTNSPFHLVSDFDGVWTEPARELQAVHATLIQELAILTTRPLSLVEEDIAGFIQKILEKPECFGWRIQGRFSSYVDEDFFALPTAIGQFLEDATSSPEKVYLDALLTKHESALDFLDSCYHKTCDRFRSDGTHDLTRGAERVLEWLLAHQVQITFVSNAPVEKIIDWFAAHGHPVVDGRSPASSEAPLRAYGRAGKQFLSNKPKSLVFGGREVQVDRPDYLALLEQASPDMVIGDVLSLDLALPLWMRQEKHPAAPIAVALMHLKHSPDWVTRDIGKTPHAPDFLVPHITSLPRLVTEVRRMKSAGLAPV